MRIGGTRPDRWLPETHGSCPFKRRGAEEVASTSDVRRAYCFVALTNLTVPLLSVIWNVILNFWPLARTAVQLNDLPFLTPTSEGHLADIAFPPLAVTTCFVNPSALPWSMTLLPQPVSASAPTPTTTGKAKRV